MNDDQSKNHTVLPFNHCSSIIDLCLRSIYEAGATSGCAPMRNENADTDSHGLRSQIFTIYPRSFAFIRVLFTKQTP